MKKSELINLIKESIGLLKEDEDIIPQTETSNYFTFGGFNHPSLYNYCVKITAQTPAIARQRMFELFGEKWGFQYDKKPFESVIDTNKAVALNKEWLKNK